jgi:hypothetical protein
MNGLVSSISAQIILMIASFRSKERGRRICQYIFLQSTTTIIRSVTVTFTTPNIFTPDYCTEKTRNIFETFWSMLLNGTCGDYVFWPYSNRCIDIPFRMSLLKIIRICRYERCIFVFINFVFIITKVALQRGLYHCHTYHFTYF